MFGTTLAHFLPRSIESGQTVRSTSLFPKRKPMRCGCTVHCPESPPLVMSWSLGISAGVLLLGLIGLATPISKPIAPLQSGLEADAGAAPEFSVFELSSPDTMGEVLPTPADAIFEHVLSEPVVTSESLEPIDLVESIPLLTLVDVFEVPAASPVETALAPNQPKPAAPRTPPSVRPATGTPSSSAATSGSSGSTGTGGVSRGSGKGQFPSPPYPATARSRGMQGTVALNIQVAADGRASAVQIARSSGFTDLDRHALQWVQRNWRWPAGQTGNFRQSVVFRLR